MVSSLEEWKQTALNTLSVPLLQHMIHDVVQLYLKTHWSNRLTDPLRDVAKKDHVYVEPLAYLAYPV